MKIHYLINNENKERVVRITSNARCPYNKKEVISAIITSTNLHRLENLELREECGYSRQLHIGSVSLSSKQKENIRQWILFGKKSIISDNDTRFIFIEGCGEHYSESFDDFIKYLEEKGKSKEVAKIKKALKEGYINVEEEWCGFNSDSAISSHQEDLLLKLKKKVK